MELVVPIVSALLALSVAGNFVLFRRFKQAAKQPTADATEFLRDLARGNAIIVVRRIDPEEIYVRSVRA